MCPCVECKQKGLSPILYYEIVKYLWYFLFLLKTDVLPNTVLIILALSIDHKCT